MQLHRKSLLLLGTIVLAGCVTTTEQGETVRLAPSEPEGCESLGPVHSDLTMYGYSSELQASMRNKVARMGGNVLYQVAESSGFAYKCPE